MSLPGTPDPNAWTRTIHTDQWAKQLRLIVDGRDVTTFRDIPTQLGTYGLQEPYGYGSFSLSLPQVSGLEFRSDPRDMPRSLQWLHESAPVVLRAVNNAGNVVEVVYRGFISKINLAGDHVEVECDGDLAGRLALKDKQPPVGHEIKDIGRHLWWTCAHVNVPVVPHLGTTTGIEIPLDGGGSSLDWTDHCLAMGQTLTGDQWTLMPVADSRVRRYEMRLKDRSTVHATWFYDGTSLSVSTDMAEKPTTGYGSGTLKGEDWRNVKRPGYRQGATPPFPGILQRGDVGEDVFVLMSRLRVVGALTHRDSPGSYDQDVVEAVRSIQRRAGLDHTGIVNRATWDALWDVSEVGRSKRKSVVAPLYEAAGVRKFKTSATGAILGRNPRFDPSRVEVDWSVEFESTRKERADQWMTRRIEQLEGKQWTGSLTLTADVYAGNVTGGATSPSPMSRFALRPGMNILVRHFDGDTKFHIAGVDVDPGGAVTLALDTHARDLIELAEIRERNRESRKRPGRKKGGGRGRARPKADERFGYLDSGHNLQGGRWNIVTVPASSEGIIRHVELQTTGARSELAAAIFSRKVTIAALNSRVPHPLNNTGTSSTWLDGSGQRQWLREHGLVWAAGDYTQPGGYSPGRKHKAVDMTGDDPVLYRSSHSLTGLLEDAGTFDYECDEDGEPTLYVAIFPQQDCTLTRGRILRRHNPEKR